MSRHPFPRPVSTLSAVVLAAMISLEPGPAVCADLFVRSDADGSGDTDVTDPITTLGYMFLGTPARLACDDAADTNDNGELDVGDAINTLSTLFLGTSAPAAPYPECGEDPTADGLDCDESPRCARVPEEEEEDLCEGFCRINSAGTLRLVEEYSGLEGETGPSTDSEVFSSGAAVVCTTEGWGESEVRTLAETVGLNLTGTTIYPGALLQGAFFAEGLFAPVTIPRAGGTIVLSNLALQPNALYSADVDRVSFARVQQATQNLLSQGVVAGTAANASFIVEQTYDYDHMLFELGVDARFGFGTMQSSLDIDNTRTRNFVFAKFTQIFYDITFEDPPYATDVFRDGEDFRDPEDQIRENNPPLYVSKVSYGRMVFFVAESEHDAEDLKATFHAAFNGLVGGVELDSGLTHQQVMSSTKIRYFVVGGDAGLALAPIDSAGPSEMYNAVKNFLANPRAARFSLENPGAPIAYSLNYLADRTPARMSYFVSYGRKDCSYHEKQWIRLDSRPVTFIPRNTSGGDRDFADHGPRIDSYVRFRVSQDGTQVEAQLSMDAMESYDDGRDRNDYTRAWGESGWVAVYTAPPGKRVFAPDAAGFPEFHDRYIDDDHDVNARYPDRTRRIVKKIELVGDTRGDEAGTRTRMTVHFGELPVRLEDATR